MTAVSSYCIWALMILGLFVRPTISAAGQHERLGVDRRVNMIMVPANDAPALRKFYQEGLGWTPWAGGGFKVGTSVLVFVNAKYLSQESGLSAPAAPKAIMAVFVVSQVEVDRQMSRVVQAGGKIVSPVRDRDGGLYSGYFTDPEGNAWEIVWSPTMPLDAEGSLTVKPR